MRRSFLNLVALAVVAVGGTRLATPVQAQTSGDLALRATCTQGGVTLTGDHCKINSDNRCECWDN